MQQIKPALNWLAARLLLQTAIDTVYVMRWLYFQRLIGKDDTDRFFSAAKWLAERADRFASRATRPLSKTK